MKLSELTPGAIYKTPAFDGAGESVGMYVGKGYLIFKKKENGGREFWGISSQKPGLIDECKRLGINMDGYKFGWFFYAGDISGEFLPAVSIDYSNSVPAEELGI